MFKSAHSLYLAVLYSDIFVGQMCHSYGQRPEWLGDHT
jgi:hypothetical protein